MNWSWLIEFARLALAALGLVLLGRLLRSARIYLSWRAFVYYAAAWLAFPVLGVFWLALPGLGGLRLLFEALFLLGMAGSLFEHVRADRRRHRDARRLMEQWRLATGLARKRSAELEVVAAITATLVASLDLGQVLQAVVDQALRLAEADSVSVYVIDRETGTVRVPGVSALAGQAGGLTAPAPRANGLTASVTRSGEPAFIAEAAEHPLFADGARPNLRAIASVPLRLNGVVVGVLNVSYHRPHTFDDDERQTLGALADAAALAIHNATQHERLARLAVTDDLTGLPNRRRFLEALRTEAQRARRYQRPLALLMLDLDDLKTVNDRHGHAAGDEVLRGVAQALRADTRDTDLAARLSGDEFGVVLPETEAEAALSIAERIRASVAAFRVPVADGHAGATVSIGLASASAAALPELPRFLHLADQALYRAKVAGRNRVAQAAGPGAGEPAAEVSPAPLSD